MQEKPSIFSGVNIEKQFNHRRKQSRMKAGLPHLDDQEFEVVTSVPSRTD